jgi:tRNA A-37 threonylcarbamoyl transferase component Bud32
MEPGRTSQRGLHWWIYVAALSFILTFGFFFYLILEGPNELLGFVVAYTDDVMLIRSIDDPNSTVARGGVRAGDRVLSINDQPVRNVRDWNAVDANSWVGRPSRWVVSRNGERITLEIVPKALDFRSKLAMGYLQLLPLILTGFFLGLLIAWKRPDDPVALIGAWFIITASNAFGLPAGWAVLWRELPRLLQLLLWIPQLSRFVLEGILLSFFVLFPRSMIKRRWVWFAIWVPVLITLPWRVAAFARVIYPNDIGPVPAWIIQAGSVRTLLYLFIGIGVLARSYRRFLDANEKRRVRILMLGTAVSLIAATITVWLDSFAGRMTGAWNVFVYGVVPFYGACPLSLAYAILRHRVLDISIIIRQGLQYALARGGVIGFVPGLAGILVLDLAVNSDQRLGDIFRNRGWIYAGAAVLSLAAYWKRREWLAAIDRRFFRERYNAQQVLRDVLGEIRAAENFDRASARVVERIETALHPESVSVMVRFPGEPVFRSVATLPAEHEPPHLAADSKVVALLHVLGKPLEFLTGDSDWLDQRLPRDESEFVRASRIDLLVPITSAPAQTEALLALGVKRSDARYTHEDQQLLEAIAGSLALLLEQRAMPDRRSKPSFKECPECGMCYEVTVSSCEADDAELVAMRIPRLLASRYRLARRRGQGGMGSVYEATDSALERRVAIKLIRDDWVDSPEALQRFRKEARAAAGFTHPNVVTIYDYGIEGETRAFLVMELLEGVTLRDELKRRQRLEPSRMVSIFRGVCAAVEAAHQRDLIHRDLKPENIFIARSAGETGEVIKVLDFGIAKFLPAHDDSAPTLATAATHTGVLIGTPAYMPPEQLLGEDLNVSWDLWALTVVAYESLTGAPPFAASIGGDWRRAILSGNLTPLSAHIDHPPERWESFFVRSFAADRTKRAASVSEFLEQVEEAFLGSSS